MASKSKAPPKNAKGSAKASSSSIASSSDSASTSNSACVIIPPQDMWDAIQEIRSSNDTSFDRWPPHINLLWPFIPQSQFASATTSIQSSSKFSSIQPFTVRLSRFSYTHGSRYIHLVADCVDPSSGSILPWPPVITKGKKKEIVSTPIQDLFVALMEVFPGCERPFLDENGLPSEWFLPHLSVGQVDQATIRETVASLQSGWTPIEFEVNELTFLARSGPNKPFQSILTVPLR